MISTLLAGAFALHAATVTLALDTTPCEFGVTYQVSSAHCTLSFTNTSDRTIRVVSATGALNTDSIRPTNAAIAPKATVYFEATANVQNDLGRSEHWFYVTTDSQSVPKRFTKITGFVMSVLDAPKPEVDFGVVQAGGRPTDSKSLSFSSTEVADFRVLSVSKAPQYVEAHVTNGGNAMELALKPNAPWGLLDDYVTLATNTSKQPSVNVHVRANVQGEVIPSSNPYELGVMRKGQLNEALIRLTSRSATEFRVGRMAFDRLDALAEVLPCEPATAGCKLLRVRLTDEQTAGVINGRVLVDLPDLGHELPIAIEGLLIKQNAKIKELNNPNEPRQGGKGKSELEPQNKPLDLGLALRRATKKDDVEPAGRGPLLKWAASNEELVFGYAVYRGDSKEGPFVRINEDLIEVIGGDTAGSSYQWRDNGAVSGKTYWYYVGAVHNNGTREPLSEPQKVVAK